MRSLLTGYAGAFNRRHHRVGHLFQNRYKSIVVEEDPYLLELVRYLHLNPLRAEVVADLRALDRFPWTGHSALLGTVAPPWQDTATILSQFGPTRARAIRPTGPSSPRGFPTAAAPSSRAGASSGVTAAGPRWRPCAGAGRPTRGMSASSGAAPSSRATAGRSRRPPRPVAPLDTILARVCRSLGVPPTALAGGGRTPTLTRARAGIAYLWVEVLGRSGRALAPSLGVHPSAIPKAARRGARAAAEWRRVACR